MSVVLLCMGAGRLWAQAGSIDGTFQAAGIPSGPVAAMVQQGDGKMVIAGSFSTIGSTGRRSIARLNLDGTVDTTFNSNIMNAPGGPITQMALQSDGKVLIMGTFSAVGTTQRSGIARLNTDGTLDTSFNAGTVASSNLRTIAVQSDGKILVGGSFGSFNGDSTRAYLVRLTSTGSIDTSFILGTNLNGAVVGVALQGDGQIVVAGNFTSVAGTTRRYLARLNTDGTLDGSFDPGTGLSYQNSASLAFQSSGKLLMTGSYSGAVSRSGLFRLNLDGSLDATFNAGSGPNTYAAIAFGVAADDSIVLAGSFTSVNGLARQYAARLLVDGALDPLFNPVTALTGSVNALAMQSDGKSVVAPSGMSVTRLLSSGTNPPSAPAPVVSFLTDGAGTRLMWTAAPYAEGYKIERSADGTSNWSLVGTTSGEGVVRHYDGGLASRTTSYYRVRAFNRYGDGPNSSVVAATTLPAVWPGQVSLSLDPVLGGVTGPQGFAGLSLAPNNCLVRPDGKLFAVAVYQPNPSAGSYTTIVRLNADGSLDQVYNASTSYSTILAMALQSDGKLLVGGSFNVSNQTATRHLARFNVDGTEDTSFTGSTDNTVYSLLLQSDGRILVGGYFQTASGAARSGIARLNADGSVDTSFNPGSGVGTNGAVQALAMDSNGDVVIGGGFYTVNGHASTNLARLNSDGSLDGSFNTGSGTNGTVTSLTLLPDGRVLAGGAFSTYNSATCGPVVRLNSDGSRDSTFSFSSTGVNFSGFLLLGDGRLVVAGQFTQSNTTFANVAVVTATGALDPSFDIGLSGKLDSVCLTADGHLVGSGSVTFADGTTQSGPVLLSLTGGIAPPFAPAAPTVTAVPGAQLQVSWPAVTNATGYIVERSSDGYTGWTQVGTAGTSPVFTDSSLPTQNTYWYRIRSSNGSGVSIPSGTASGHPQPLPGSPSPLTVRAYGYGESMLTWTESSNTSSVVIERSLDGVSGWVQVAVVSPQVTSYLDSGLTSQTGYYYRVRAVDTLGDSTASGVSGTTTAPPGSVLAGSLDPTFMPGAGPAGRVVSTYGTGVAAILLQPNGKIIICGEFTTYAGVSRKNVARLNADGSLDTSFDPGNWACNQAVAAALQADGKVLVGGTFLGSDGYTHQNVLRLNSDGSTDSTFNAASFASFYEYGLRAICLQADGRILVAGDKLVRLNTDGSLDSTFSPQFASSGFPAVFALAVTSDGHILAAGSFSYVNNVSRSNCARLNSDGSLDASFAPSYAPSGNAVLVQPDGRVLLASSSLNRYNTDGSADSSFTPPLLTSLSIYTQAVYALALQGNGKIIVGGAFTTIGSITRAGIMRLNADGTIDTSFDTGIGEMVTEVALQPDGNIVIAGAFNAIENQTRNYLARLLGNPVTWDSFQMWKIGFSINPVAADNTVPDSDGLPVLAEYALGGNPNAGNPAIFPVTGMAAQNLTLTYNKLRSDVSYWVETSTDLVNWTTGGVNQGGSGPSVTASLPMNGAPKAFLRLRFSRP